MGFFGGLGRALTAPGRQVMGTASRAVNKLPGGNALSRAATKVGGGHLGIKTRDQQGQNRTMSGKDPSQRASALYRRRVSR